MELTKNDTQKCKGIAIIGMVMLHLFCRLDNLPYSSLIWIGDTPLIYYLRLLGDVCVPIFCFCSGYAHHLLYDRYGKKYKSRIYYNPIYKLIQNVTECKEKQICLKSH